jgi:heptosyltransferase-1
MKIAIVKLSALGDIVHAMVVLQFIKKYNKNIQVDWVVEKNYKDLLEGHPDINKVHVVNLKKAKKKKSLYLLSKELRRTSKFGSYDVVIDLQGLVKSAIISKLIPSKVTLGFEKSSIREPFASIFYNKTFKYGYDENIIERNFSLVKFALGLTFSKEEILTKQPFLHASQKYSMKFLSSNKKNILLIPGASHESKLYPVKKFAKIASLIDANFLVIWGDQDEKKLADEIKYLSSHVNVLDKLSLKALIYLISSVDLVIGSDTGPTHMAWALNIPSITIFGSTPAYRNSYSTDINQVINSISIVNPLKIDKKDYSIQDVDENQISLLAKELI